MRHQRQEEQQRFEQLETPHPSPSLQSHGPQSLSSPPSPGSVLTESLLCCVLHFLPPSCVPHVTSVNLHWSEVCRSPWLWRQWFISAFPNTRLVRGGSGELLREEDEAPGAVPWRAQLKRREEVRNWAIRTLSPSNTSHSPPPPPPPSLTSSKGWSSLSSPPSFLPPPYFSSQQQPQSSPHSIPPRSAPLPVPSTFPTSPASSSFPSSPSVRVSPGGGSPLVGCSSVSSSVYEGMGVGRCGVALRGTSMTSSPPLVFRVPSSPVICLRFDVSSPPHTLLVGVERDLRVYSLRDGRMMGQVSRAHSTALLTTCDVHSEAQLMVSGSRDCSLRWFGLDSFACLRPSVKRGGHCEAVTEIRFVPSTSARWVASISLDSQLKVWDSETGQCRSSHNGEDRASVGLLLSFDCLHPSSQTYTTVSTRGGIDRRGEGRLAVWDLRTKEGVTEAVTVESCGLLPSVSYSSYQRAIAAGGSDGIVRIFDVRHLNRCHEIRVPISPLLPSHLSSVHLSTSPPSPSPSSLSAQPPSGLHLQSVFLSSNRLLTCQSRGFTVFASSSASPGRLHSLNSPFPYAHPVYSVTARDLQRWNSGGGGGSGSGGGVGVGGPSSVSGASGPLASPPSLCGFQYSEGSDVLALATRDCVVVWNAREALHMQGDFNPPSEDSLRMDTEDLRGRGAGGGGRGGVGGGDVVPPPPRDSVSSRHRHSRERARQSLQPSLTHSGRASQMGRRHSRGTA